MSHESDRVMLACLNSSDVKTICGFNVNARFGLAGAFAEGIKVL